MSGRNDSVESMDEKTLRDRVGRLAIVANARRAGGAIVDVILELGETVEVEDETLLLREGDVRGSEGYVLVDGRVSILRSEREPVELAAPVLLGEMQQFSISGSRSASVMTLGSCTVLRFSWPAFYSTLEGRLGPLDFQSVKDAIRRQSSNNAFD